MKSIVLILVASIVFAGVILGVRVLSAYAQHQRAHKLTEACRKQGGMVLDNTCVKEHKHGLETSTIGPRK